MRDDGAPTGSTRHGSVRITPVSLPMPNLLGEVTVYLVTAGSRCMVVDTGLWEPHSQETLAAALAACGIAPESVSQVVCTHYHPDHAGSARWWRDRGVPVVVADAESAALAQYFSHADYDARRARLYGDYGVPEDVAAAVEDSFAYLRRFHRPCPDCRTVQHGDRIALGDSAWTVWVTPGHTAGSLCLVNSADRVVLLGDTLLADNTVHLGFPEEGCGPDPLGTYLESLQALGRLEGYAGYAGHGSPIGDVASMAAKVAAVHCERIARLEGCLDATPRTCVALGRMALGAKRSALAQWLAAAWTYMGLLHLCATGRAQRVEGSPVRFARA